MKITIKQLETLNACAGGIEWIKTQKSLDLVDLVKAAIKEKTFTTSKGEKENTLKFANWGLIYLMDKTQKVKYAVFSARQVLGIFEAKYPKDKRPRQAIEAAEKWAAEPTEDNRKAAAAYADAADAAAADAYAYAAYAAYADAAYADDAARSRMLAKILRYGVKLVLEGAAV